MGSFQRLEEIGFREQNDSWQEEGRGEEKWAVWRRNSRTLELPSSGVFFTDKLEAKSFDERERGNAQVE